MTFMTSMTFSAMCLVLALLPVALCGMNEESKKFLEENKAKPGVIELPSGIQYKVLRASSWSKGAGSWDCGAPLDLRGDHSTDHTR